MYNMKMAIRIRTGIGLLSSRMESCFTKWYVLESLFIYSFTEGLFWLSKKRIEFQ
jgi:hypothetical protein